MTAAKKGAPRKAKTPIHPMFGAATYFDAVFTTKERHALRIKVMDVCGYGEADSRNGIPNFTGFEHDIERPAEDVIWPVFRAQGFDYNRDHGRLRDYALIHICRELQIEYKTFAANVPKLPIDGFIQLAKRAFPEFKRPRNAIERKIQEHKLRALWADWSNEECVRTGCACKSHWLCRDRFARRDDAAILEEIAVYNETRPTFAPPKLVYSAERGRKCEVTAPGPSHPIL